MNTEGRPAQKEQGGLLHRLKELAGAAGETALHAVSVLAAVGLLIENTIGSDSEVDVPHPLDSIDE